MPGVNTRPWPRPLGGRVNTPAPPPLGQLPPSPRRPPGVASREAPTPPPPPPPSLGADGRNSPPVESTAPSRVTWREGRSPQVLAPPAQEASEARPGTGGCGMSRPKMVSVSGGGGGGTGPGRSGVCTPTGRGSASGPGPDSGSRPGPPRAFCSLPSLERARESARGGGCAARGGQGGGGSWDGPWLDRFESRRARPLPTPLSTRLPRSRVVLGPEGLRGSSPKAWPGRGQPFPSHAGGRERSVARLSFPSGCSCVHPAPSPQSRTCSPRRPSADGRDLIPPAAQLGGSLIAPGRRPLALLCAAGPRPGKGQWGLRPT